MRNKITNVNDFLIMRLEALSDESLSKDELTLEVRRCSATAKIAKEVVKVAAISIEAAKLLANGILIDNLNGDMQRLKINDGSYSDTKLLG